jgi:hypothetical protein
VVASYLGDLTFWRKVSVFGQRKFSGFTLYFTCSNTLRFPGYMCTMARNDFLEHTTLNIHY